MMHSAPSVMARRIATCLSVSATRTGSERVLAACAAAVALGGSTAMPRALPTTGSSLCNDSSRWVNDEG